MFGKLPRIHDFVNLRAAGPSWGSFEGWLTQAVAWHEGSRSASWQALCAERRPLAFIYRAPRAAKSTEILAGVVWPSMDAVGRRFPFVAFSRMAERDLARAPHLLPPSLTPYFEALADRGEGLGSLGSAAEVDAYFQSIPVPDPGPPELSSSYTNWTTVTELTELWANLYGSVRGEDIESVLSMVAEAVRPFQGQESPATPLALRLPLGTAPGVNASFWIDLLRSCARWKTTVPSMFWSLAPPRTAMLLQLGDPHASSLSEIWYPDRDNDHCFDLARPPAPFAPIPDPVVRMARASLVGEALAAAALL